MFTAMFTVETFTKMSFIRRHFLGCFGDEQAFSLEKYKLSPFREIKKCSLFIHIEIGLGECVLNVTATAKEQSMGEKCIGVSQTALWKIEFFWFAQ